jgi:hypothetical protein
MKKLQFLSYLSLLIDITEYESTKELSHINRKAPKTVKTESNNCPAKVFTKDTL